MKAFKYNMESILGYRRDIEEEKRQKLAVIQGQLNQEKSLLKELEEKLTSANNSFIKKVSDINELKEIQNYINFIREKIQNQKQIISKLKTELNKRRETLILAQKDRKIIEKHRENAFDQYKDKIERIEQRTMDELALYSHMRK